MPPLKTFTYTHKETERLVFTIECYDEFQSIELLKASVRNFRDWKLTPNK